MAFVIEYLGTAPCWIAEPKTEKCGGFDVTFQRSLAQRFASVEDARKEILRLGLTVDWNVSNVGEHLEKEKS